MVRATALIAMVMMAQPVWAADQFDLLCTGKVDSQTSGPEPISRRYHVDLVKRQWCYNECTIKPFAEINNAQLVFVDTKAAYRGDPSESLDYVDRTTGAWSFFTSFWQGGGTCKPAPFTGFPSEQTKF
jgi:hypothetical protein